MLKTFLLRVCLTDPFSAAGIRQDERVRKFPFISKQQKKVGLRDVEDGLVAKRQLHASSKQHVNVTCQINLPRKQEREL